MKILTKIKKNNYTTYSLGLTILLISNVCFYNQENIPLYIILSSVGLCCVFINKLKVLKKGITLNRCISWLVLLYSMFTIYGCLFLRHGVYNWDIMLFTMVSNIALYISLSEILRFDNWTKIIRKPIYITVFFAITQILLRDGIAFHEESMRIGNSLSGNVNTTAVAFGILSIFLAYIYIKDSNKITLIVLCLTFGFMLLTGSKKSLILIALDLLLFLFLSKNKYTAYIKTGIAACVVLYLVMAVPYFYDIIGHRIQDMFFQIFGLGKASFSNVNDQSSVFRASMITEGFQIFFNNPQYYLLGGGEKFFASQSSLGYLGYSHCNYVEMLCNFGLLGTFLFYVPLIQNFVIGFKYRYIKSDLSILCMVFLLSVLVNSWFMVIYQEICISYIPCVMSFVLIKKMKEGKKYEKI